VQAEVGTRSLAARVKRNHETTEEIMQLQDTASRLEFLRARMAGVGGSDVGALLGVDPYKNAYDVYLEKTREPTADQANNIHMLRGIVLEDLAAQLYSEDTGRKLRKVKQRTHPDYDWAVVNVDRQILRSNGRGTGAMEIKAPATGGFQRILEEGAQIQHTVQLMWAMFVLGYEWGEFVAINLEHGNGPVIHFELERNEPLIENMLDASATFWHEHVEPRVPPVPGNWPYFQAPLEVPALGQGDAHIIKVGDDDDAYAAYLDALEAHAWRKQAEEHYESAKLHMLELAGERRIKVVGDEGSVSVFWNAGRTTFDSTRLGACGPIDPDKLWAWLKENGLGVGSLKHLELDLTPFHNVSDAHQVVRVTPKKGAK
jgi:putative phage-type endonuclease